MQNSYWLTHFYGCSKSDNLQAMGALLRCLKNRQWTPNLQTVGQANQGELRKKSWLGGMKYGGGGTGV